MTPETRRFGKNARKTKRRTGGAAHTGQVVSHSLADRFGFAEEHHAATEAARKVERACDSFLERTNIEARVGAWKIANSGDPRLKQTIEDANLSEIIAEILSTPLAVTRAMDAAHDGAIFLQSKALSLAADITTAVAKIPPLFSSRSKSPAAPEPSPSRASSSSTTSSMGSWFSRPEPSASRASSSSTTSSARGSWLLGPRAASTEDNTEASENILYNAYGHSFNNIPASEAHRYQRKIRTRRATVTPAKLTPAQIEQRRSSPISELPEYGFHQGDFFRPAPKR